MIRNTREPCKGCGAPWFLRSAKGAARTTDPTSNYFAPRSVLREFLKSAQAAERGPNQRATSGLVALEASPLCACSSNDRLARGCGVEFGRARGATQPVFQPKPAEAGRLRKQRASTAEFGNLCILGERSAVD